MNKNSFSPKQREKIINGLPAEFKNNYKNYSPEEKAILASSFDEFLTHLAQQKEPMDFLKNNVNSFSFEE